MFLCQINEIMNCLESVNKIEIDIFQSIRYWTVTNNAEFKRMFFIYSFPMKYDFYREKKNISILWIKDSSEFQITQLKTLSIINYISIWHLKKSTKSTFIKANKQNWRGEKIAPKNHSSNWPGRRELWKWIWIQKKKTIKAVHHLKWHLIIHEWSKYIQRLMHSYSSKQYRSNCILTM